MRPLGNQPLSDPAKVPVHTAAVCIHPRFVPVAVAALASTGVAVAAAAGDFPSGRAALSVRMAEVESAVAAGAQEIDAVVDRRHIHEGHWRALYEEVSVLREACGGVPLKTILGTGALAGPTEVARASRVAIMAGSDFIKTSTGKEKMNATLSAGLAMARQIRAHWELTGHQVGLKPAGGMRTADDALRWIALVAGELGEGWLEPARFRIGASALLDELRSELDAQPPS